MSTDLEWVERLRNSCTWRNGTEEDEAIGTMSYSRCESVIGWLKGKAVSIEAEECAQAHFGRIPALVLSDSSGPFSVQSTIAHWERVPSAAPPVWGTIRSLPAYVDRRRMPLSWLLGTPLLRALATQMADIEAKKQLDQTLRESGSVCRRCSAPLHHGGGAKGELRDITSDRVAYLCASCFATTMDELEWTNPC